MVLPVKVSISLAGFSHRRDSNHIGNDGESHQAPADS